MALTAPKQTFFSHRLMSASRAPICPSSLDIRCAAIVCPLLEADMPEMYGDHSFGLTPRTAKARAVR